jgi:hypothetical protein
MIHVFNVTWYVWQSIKNLCWIFQLPKIWFWKENFTNLVWFSNKNTSLKHNTTHNTESFQSRDLYEGNGQLEKLVSQMLRKKSIRYSKIIWNRYKKSCLCHFITLEDNTYSRKWIIWLMWKLVDYSANDWGFHALSSGPFHSRSPDVKCWSFNMETC